MAHTGQLTHSKEHILSKCKDAFGDIYSYENMVYVNAEVPITITCNIHGDFTRRVYDHVSRKRGCPKCTKQFHIDYTKPGVLYYISITINGRTLYKIGVTSKSIEERFYNWELSMINVISVQGFTTVKEAIKREKELLLKYSKWQYKGEPVINTGNSELFSINILNLTKEAL